MVSEAPWWWFLFIFAIAVGIGLLIRKCDTGPLPQYKHICRDEVFSPPTIADRITCDDDQTPYVKDGLIICRCKLNQE